MSKPPLKIAQTISNSNPDFIGFSTNIWNYKKIIEITRILKEKNDDPIIFLGGSYVSPLAKKVLTDNPSVDIVIRGEGEVTVQKLLECLLDSSPDLSSVKGLTFRNNQQITSTPYRPPIKNLERIASPYLTDPPENLDGKEAYIETQRGCPNNCYYCDFSHGYSGIRKFGLKKIKKELKYILSHDISSLHFADGIFNLNLERAKEICRFVIDLKEKHIPVGVNIEIGNIDEELAQLFSQGKFKVLLGLQTISPRVAQTVNRELDKKTVKEGFQLLSSNDVFTVLTSMMGLPEATEKTMLETMRFAVNRKPDHLAPFPCQILPGTVLWETRDSLDLKFDPKPLHIVYKNQNVPTEKLMNIYRLGRAIFVIFIHMQREKEQYAPEKILEVGKDWSQNSSFWQNIGRNNLNDFYNLDVKKALSELEKSYL